MPVVHAPETAYAQEMRKWEAHYTPYGPPGRPWTTNAEADGGARGPGVEFPKMLFKATRQADGTRTIEQHIVRSDDDQRNMQSRGFCVSQELALEALDREHTEHGILAAELNFEARRMSPKAAAEIEAAQEAHGAKHMPVMPEKPKRKYVRKQTTE